MRICIVAAVDLDGSIGKKGVNKLLWHLPADLARFKELTLNRFVVMGRKTFESIGKPLPDRTNIVLTRNPKKLLKKMGLEEGEDLKVVSSKGEALKLLPDDEVSFVIGGAEIYKDFFPAASYLHLTRVYERFGGDIILPNKNDFGKWSLEEACHYGADNKNSCAQKVMVFEKTKM